VNPVRPRSTLAGGRGRSAAGDKRFASSNGSRRHGTGTIGGKRMNAAPATFPMPFSGFVIPAVNSPLRGLKTDQRCRHPRIVKLKFALGQFFSYRDEFRPSRIRGFPLDDRQGSC
jgi:hypothetical protein